MKKRRRNPVQGIDDPLAAWRLGRTAGQRVLIDALGRAWTLAGIADAAYATGDQCGRLMWNRRDPPEQVHAALDRKLKRIDTLRAGFLRLQAAGGRPAPWLHLATILTATVPDDDTYAQLQDGVRAARPQPSDLALLARVEACWCVTCGEWVHRPAPCDPAAWQATVRAFAARHPIAEDLPDADAPLVA